MFSGVRSVICFCDRRVCVVPVDFYRLPSPFLHPDRRPRWRTESTVRVRAPDDLCLTICRRRRRRSLTPHSLRTTDAPRPTPSSVPRLDRTVPTSHDRALLRRPCPGASWEIEGIHVEIEARRLEEEEEEEGCCHV